MKIQIKSILAGSILMMAFGACGGSSAKKPVTPPPPAPAPAAAAAPAAVVAPAPDPRVEVLDILNRLDMQIAAMKGTIGSSHGNVGANAQAIMVIVQELAMPLGQFPVVASQYTQLQEHAKHLVEATTGHGTKHGKAHKHYKEVVDNAHKIREGI